MLAFMKPDLLLDYKRLIEKDLQNQLVDHEKRVSSMPIHLQQCLKNIDLKHYKISNEPAQNDQQTQKEENPLEIQIKKFIQLKNTQQKSNSNKKSKQKLQHIGSRKSRTTITVQKLKLMNQLFKEFLEQSKPNHLQNSDQQRQYIFVGVQTLKDISKILDLSYSTVLNKFKQFKATNQVKPSALIYSIFQKRNYKKSTVLQDLLRTCLQERAFFSAIQIKQYIKEKYNQNYSRSTISRNLLLMGNSIKNLINNKKQQKEIKFMREAYASAFQTINDQDNSEVYYLDEFVFEFQKQQHMSQGIQIQDEAQKQIHLIVFASKKGIIKYELSPFAIDQVRFTRILREMKEYFESTPQNPKILVLDLDNQLHYGQVMLKTKGDLKKLKLHMLYLPPSSHKMSLLQWFFNQIKQQLQKLKFTEFHLFKETIEKMIEGMEEQKLQKHYQISMNYINLSLLNRNF